MRLTPRISAFLRMDWEFTSATAIFPRHLKKRPGIGAAALALTLTVSGPLRAEVVHFTPNPQPHSIVVDWIEAMLMAIEQNPPAPTATTWRMLVATTSMYDAWSAYDDRALSVTDGMALKRQSWEHTDVNKKIAVSHAAYHALSYLFPNQQAIFDDVMDLHGLVPTDSTDTATPEGIGNVAAGRVIDARQDDGSNAANGFKQLTSGFYPQFYTPVNSANPLAPNSLGGPEWDPNRWTPLRVPNGKLIDEDGNPYYLDEDPGTYSDQTFLTPHWGAVIPYALTSGDQFRPPAPPQLESDEPYTDALGNLMTNDEAYRNQAEEVLQFSAGLTDEHKIIAEFWADGPGSWTPPGHWMQLANGISIRDGHGIDEDVRMYLAIAGAVFDAGIVAWEAKRVYDFIRPASAIPHLYQGQQVFAWGGPNQGTQLIDGGAWQPYQQSTFITPAFAEFVSGHSTFSAAAAHILRSYTGSDAMYDGVTTIGRDYDGDGVEDLLGRHYAVPGAMVFEDGPALPVELRWDTFSEAAQEAGISRLYGGIHFQDGNLHGQQAGNKVGAQAWELSELYWDPFGELIETAEEFAASGDIDRFLATVLANLSLNAQRAFTRQRPNQVCMRLNAMEKIMFQMRHRARGNATFSDEAALRFDGQLDTIAGLVCRGQESARPPMMHRVENAAAGWASGPGSLR